MSDPAVRHQGRALEGNTRFKRSMILSASAHGSKPVFDLNLKFGREWIANRNATISGVPSCREVIRQGSLARLIRPSTLAMDR